MGKTVQAKIIRWCRGIEGVNGEEIMAFYNGIENPFLRMAFYNNLRSLDSLDLISREALNFLRGDEQFSFSNNNLSLFLLAEQGLLNADTFNLIKNCDNPVGGATYLIMTYSPLIEADRSELPMTPTINPLDLLMGESETTIPVIEENPNEENPNEENPNNVRYKFFGLKVPRSKGLFPSGQFSFDRGN